MFNEKYQPILPLWFSSRGYLVKNEKHDQDLKKKKNQNEKDRIWKGDQVIIPYRLYAYLPGKLSRRN